MLGLICYEFWEGLAIQDPRIQELSVTAVTRRDCPLPDWTAEQSEHMGVLRFVLGLPTLPLACP